MMSLHKRPMGSGDQAQGAGDQTLGAGANQSSACSSVDPVTVNIFVDDQYYSTFMDRVSVFVLYVCNQCGHACRTLPLLAKHIQFCASNKLPNIGEKLNDLLDTWNKSCVFGKRDDLPELFTFGESSTSEKLLERLPSYDDENKSAVRSIQKEMAVNKSEKMDIADNESHIELVLDIQDNNSCNSTTLSPIEHKSDVRSSIQHKVPQTECEHMDIVTNESHIEIVLDTHDTHIPNAEYLSQMEKKSAKILDKIVDRCESDDDIIDLNSESQIEIISALIKTKKNSNSKPGIDGVNFVTRRDDVTELNAEEFHEDDVAVPDYISKVKSRSTTKKSTTKKPLTKIESDSQPEAVIQRFLAKYEQFVAENVRTLFTHMNRAVVVVPVTDNGAPSWKSVIQHSSDFDFNQDVESVLCIPDLEAKPETRSKWQCMDCPNTKLLSETELSFHLMCHTNTVDQFKCYACVRRVTKATNRSTKWPAMQVHLSSVHSIDFKLPCQYCSRTYASSEKLEMHIKKWHKQLCKYLGTGCKFVTSDLAEMKLHEKCHDELDSKLSRCPLCEFRPKKRTSFYHVRRHITKLHPEQLQHKYTCPGCGLAFGSKAKYKQHYYYGCLQVKHLYHTCMFCLTQTSVPVVALHDHLQIHIQSILFQTRFKRAIEMSNQGTSILEIYSALRNRLSTPLVKSNERHARNISTQTKCIFCYKKLKNQLSLERHMLKSHPEGNDDTVCQMCGRLFRTKNQYRNHFKEVHTGLSRKRTYRPPKENIKKVEKERPILRCAQCAYTSPYTTRLRNHTMSVHMGVFPYKCTECSYGTNEVSDLRRHKNKHLGTNRSKSFSCGHCQYKCAYYWLLATHCKRQHDVELPKKRKPFNFMGTEGSMRWQRKRAKDRDVQKRAAQSGSKRFVLPKQRHQHDTIVISPLPQIGAMVQARETVQITPVAVVSEFEQASQSSEIEQIPHISKMQRSRQISQIGQVPPMSQIEQIFVQDIDEIAIENIVSISNGGDDERDAGLNSQTGSPVEYRELAQPNTSHIIEYSEIEQTETSGVECGEVIYLDAPLSSLNQATKVSAQGETYYIVQ